MSQNFRVRYAPSPTGYQHIGSMRTFLFDYLAAKANNGAFILRIEDTDRARYFDGALQDIFDTFGWLGIDYDEGPGKNNEHGPYVQSERKAIYEKYVLELVRSGKAYFCFCDSARLEDVKQGQAENKDSNLGYDRRCRNLPAGETERLLKENKAHVVRIKSPLDGKTSFRDIIFGNIEFDNKTLQDIILMKSDGYSTYHLASVVDDHLMEISHVLRGQEWIPTSPYQKILYESFGWTMPQYCHLPMVLGEDGQKLSKRHGATQVKEFISQGYLPEALINFVVLLGWSYNDKDEIFSMEELKKNFTLERINKSGAIFNYSKLKWFNGVYIRKKSREELLNLLLPYYIGKKLVQENPSEEEKQYLLKIIPLIQERLELLSDAPAASDFMFGELPEYRTWEAAVTKNVDKETVISVLEDSMEILKDLGSSPDEELQHKIYDLSAKYKIKAGAVFMPIRIAVTGVNKSPELFPVMNVLGRERVMKRMQAAIQKLRT